MALQFAEAQTGQQGMNRDQLATVAQASTIGSSTYKPPNVNAPVSTSTLTAPSTNYPSTAPDNSSTPFVGSINDSLKYFQDLYNTQKTQFDTAQKERDDLRKILGDSYSQLDTLPDVYRQTEEKFGIPQQYEDLNKINLQIADLTGAYDKEFGRVETKGIQSGTPAIFYQGEQAAIQRQKSIEIGALGVRQAAMAGNLDLANQRAAKTVELQFKPIENRIKKTLDFIAMNYDDMTAAEKRMADSRIAALALQEKSLGEQKEIRNLALTSGVTQPYFMKVGDPTVYRTSDGKPYSNEQDFLKDGGNFSKIQTINPAESAQVQELMSEFKDAGILPSDSLAVATQKLSRSRIYQDKVRGPVGPAPTGLTSINIVDKNTDNQVKNIINANISKGYGDAYNAVKQQLGERVAQAYDKVYQSVFNSGASIDAAFNDAKLAPTQEQIATQQSQQLYAKDNIDTIDSLLSNKSIDQAVGPNALSRSTTGFWSNLVTAGPIRDLFNPGRTNFIADVEKLSSQLTLETLQNAKKNGATFGALSDSELSLLASAGSKIGSWAIKKDGKTIGYNAKEKDFKAELDKINYFTKLDYIRKGGNPEEVGVKVMPDGTRWLQNSDGTLTPL